MKLPQAALRHSGRVLTLGLRYSSTIRVSPATVPLPTIEVSKTVSQHSRTIPNALRAYKEAFPKDTNTNSLIDTYLRLGKIKEPIKIALLYDNTTTRSKVIESLLADPLAKGNETWFNELLIRSNDVENRFQFEDNEEIHHFGPETYSIPSPILSASLRAPYPDALGPEATGIESPGITSDVELIEIHNVAQLSEELCHFYIEVTNDFSPTKVALPLQIQSRLLLTVIDNKEYTVPSSASSPTSFDTSRWARHHMIKIDSETSFSGISKFLQYDTDAATEYLNALRDSNIIELLKFISWYTRSNVLRQWYLNSIIRDISSASKDPASVSDLYTQLKFQDIPAFGNSVHLELQSQFIPRVSAFLKSIRWWKLYLRNDNIEYDFKDFFNKEFMTLSIEKYNYLRGKIVSSLQHEKFGAYTEGSAVKNPLVGYKNALINEKIESEVQPVVYTTLLNGFVMFQLPVSAVAILWYLFLGIQLESAVALGLLGWTVGFNYVARQWEIFTTKWLKDLFEDIRVLLGQSVDEGLLKELKSKYEEELALVEKKRDIIKDLKRLLSK